MNYALIKVMLLILYSAIHLSDENVLVWC